MRETEKALSRAAIAALWIFTIVVELILTWTLLINNAWVAVIRGYWMFFWVFFAAWGILTTVWISVMSVFISRKKRKRFQRAMREF